jgi:tetratricopeptide (TPR) repeat protein
VLLPCRHFDLVSNWMAGPPTFRGVVVLTAAFVITCRAQVAQKSHTSDDLSTAHHALNMAEKGRCAEALPTLKKTFPKLDDKELKRKAGLAGVRCAMTVGKPEASADFLEILARAFPNDPEVLYVLVHAYSDLSTHAAQQLAQTAPDSEQAHMLNAEALEMQGKWDAAAAEYQKVLQKNPKMPGVHFRVGRLLLSRPNPTPDMAEQARKEFLEELNIDPNNAGAEYVLGELAHQEQQLDEAVQHFSRAAKLDPSFGDAFLGLGAVLISLRKFNEAIPPLETAAKLEAGNPAVHYNLAMAYSRVGRKPEADKEFAIHRQLTQNNKGQGQDDPAQSPN